MPRSLFLHVPVAVSPSEVPTAEVPAGSPRYGRDVPFPSRGASATGSAAESVRAADGAVAAGRGLDGAADGRAAHAGSSRLAPSVPGAISSAGSEAPASRTLSLTAARSQVVTTFVRDLQVHRVFVLGVDHRAAQARRGGDDVADLQRRLELLHVLHLPALLAPRQEDRDEQQEDEQGEQQAAE